jgi:hypothetical protein
MATRTKTFLWTTVAGLLALGAAGLAVRTWAAEETQPVKAKNKTVSNVGDKKDLIDYNDADATSPESVTPVGQGVKVASKTFTPPGTMKFKTFPNKTTYVDIQTDPGGLPADRDRESPSEIRVSVTAMPETAGQYPLAAEGNLAPSGGKGTPPELHWAAKVSDVKAYWETYDQPTADPNTPIDDHPAVPANGGKRIFPGEKKYNDTSEDANNRRRAFAVLEFPEGVTPPPDTVVYFRMWDVDDPSADKAPIDTAGLPNPGTNGPDNRDNDWCFAGEENHIAHVEVGEVKRFDTTTTCETTKAKMTARVGMQPGDNWRFAVAWGEGAQARLQAMTQVQADSCQPPGGVFISGMLTTWRKVHVEIDSMPTEPNTWPDKDPDCNTCIVESVIVDSPVAGESTIDTFGPIFAPEVDHYEGGNLWKNTSPPRPRWPIMKHTANQFFGDQIIVMGTPTAGEISSYMVNQVCSLADDDPLAISQLPLFPGVGPVLTSRFGKAYIEPVAVDDNENTNKIVPEFYLNLSYWDIVLYSDWTARDLPVRQEDYWVAYVVMGYQGENSDPWSNTALDLDPDGHANFYPPMPYYTVALEVGWFGVAHSGYAAVFVETSRDAMAKSISPVEWPSVDEIMTHEIGHLGGAHDRENGIMNTDGMKRPDWFSPQDIAIFRTNPYFKPADE